MSTAAQSAGAIVANGDLYDQKTDRFIDAATVKALSQIKQWRGIFQIVLEWIGIFGAIFICNRYWNPILYIATVMWIGARQNGLGVLMHESVHYRLLRNKTLNEWVGDLFTAWPVLVTVDGFRQTHWAHHRHVNGPDDPDWQMERRYPRSVLEVITITLSFWIGLHGP